RDGNGWRHCLFHRGRGSQRRKIRHGGPDCDNPVTSRRLRDRRAWFLDRLSRYRAAVGVAVGHGIARIVRAFGIGKGQGGGGGGRASSALGEGLADALNVGGY